MQGIWSRTVLRDRSYHVHPRSSTTRTISNLTKRPVCRIGRLPNRVPSASYYGATVGSAMSDAEAEAVATEEQGHESGHNLDETHEKLAHMMEHTAASDLAAAIRAASSYPIPVPRPVDKTLLDWVTLQGVSRQHQNHSRFRSGARDLKDDFWLAKGFHKKDKLLGLAECWELIKQHDASSFKDREPKTVKQLEKQIKQIKRLVDNLMGVALSHEAVTPERRRASRSLDSPWNMLRMLRSEGYPRYVHPGLDPGATQSARAALNEANMKILSEWVPFRIDKSVAKICHNLLVSQVPPGINNYNLLVLGFSQLRYYDLADVVADSFLRSSRYLPTNATSLSLLHHYRLKGDLKGFQELIQRLIARHEEGFLVRRRDISEFNIKDPWFRQWLRTASPRYVNGWLVEPVHLEQVHWEAIVQGLVRFHMLREAAQIFVGCLDNGQLLGGSYVRELFRACIEVHSLPAARTIIDGLVRHLGAARIIISDDDPLNRFGLARQVRFLFNMVMGSPTFLLDSFREDSRRRGLDLSAPTVLQQHGEAQEASMRAEVAHLAFLLWAEELSICIDRHADAVAKVKHELDARDDNMDARIVASRARPHHYIMYPWLRLQARERYNCRWRRLGRYMALWWHTRHLDRDIEAAKMFIEYVEKQPSALMEELDEQLRDVDKQACNVLKDFLALVHPPDELSGHRRLRYKELWKMTRDSIRRNREALGLLKPSKTSKLPASKRPTSNQQDVGGLSWWAKMLDPLIKT